MNCKSHYTQPLTGVSAKHQQLRRKNAKCELAIIIEYFEYTKIIVGIIILIASIMNYDQMMHYLDLYQLWLEESGTKTMSLNLTLFSIYLLGVLLCLPSTPMAIFLGYSLQIAHESMTSKSFRCFII